MKTFYIGIVIIMKFFINSFLFVIFGSLAYGLSLKDEKLQMKDDVVVVYPSAEENDDNFQNRRSDSFATIDVPIVHSNIFNRNGRINKLAHCQQNPTCIAQFSCTATPFDYGSECNPSLWPADSNQEAWAFNANTGRCQPFRYGGCDGSLNTFSTRMECENLCEPKEISKPRQQAGLMSPVTDFFKSVMTRVNDIPNWISEKLGKRRLDNKVDNAQQGSKQVDVKVEVGEEMEHEKNKQEFCWVPIFCGMQRKVQSWFQERMGSRRSRRFEMEQESMKQQQQKQHVPNFGRRRL